MRNKIQRKWSPCIKSHFHNHRAVCGVFGEQQKLRDDGFLHLKISRRLNKAKNREEKLFKGRNYCSIKNKTTILFFSASECEQQGQTHDETCVQDGTIQISFPQQHKPKSGNFGQLWSAFKHKHRILGCNHSSPSGGVFLCVRNSLIGFDDDGFIQSSAGEYSIV